MASKEFRLVTYGVIETCLSASLHGQIRRRVQFEKAFLRSDEIQRGITRERIVAILAIKLRNAETHFFLFKIDRDHDD